MSEDVRNLRTRAGGLSVFVCVDSKIHAIILTPYIVMPASFSEYVPHNHAHFYFKHL